MGRVPKWKQVQWDRPKSRARAQRVKQWIDWAEDHPDDSPGLPDEALSRDSIYSDRS